MWHHVTVFLHLFSLPFITSKTSVQSTNAVVNKDMCTYVCIYYMYVLFVCVYIHVMYTQGRRERSRPLGLLGGSHGL
jgi:hypothetical protein